MNPTNSVAHTPPQARGSFWDSYGFHPSDNVPTRDSDFLLFYAILDGASIILSPIVGIVRIIASSALLLARQDRQPRECRYLKGQIVHGIGDLLCLGPLLAILGVALTIIRAMQVSYKPRKEDQNDTSRASPGSFWDSFGAHRNGNSPVCSDEMLGFFILDAASILLSPIVGIVRMIASCFFLLTAYARTQRNLDYYKAQLVRGGCELLCLGPLLAIISLVVTVGRAMQVEPRYD